MNEKITIDIPRGAKLTLNGEDIILESGQITIETDYMEDQKRNLVGPRQRQLTIDVEMYEPESIE